MPQYGSLDVAARRSTLPAVTTLARESWQSEDTEVLNFVYEIDENIIACVTLYFYPDKPHMAEVGSLYVMPFYHNRGVGKKLVDYACMVAKERGAKTIIALSTQSFGFFTNVAGFEETTKDALPEARLRLYEESGRKAKVLMKPLA